MAWSAVCIAGIIGLGLLGEPDPRAVSKEAEQADTTWSEPAASAREETRAVRPAPPPIVPKPAALEAPRRGPPSPKLRRWTKFPPPGNGAALLTTGVVGALTGGTLWVAFSGGCIPAGPMIGVPVIAASAGVLTIGGIRAKHWRNWKRRTGRTPPPPGGGTIAGGVVTVGGGIAGIAVGSVVGTPMVSVAGLAVIGVGTALIVLGSKKRRRFMDWWYAESERARKPR